MRNLLRILAIIYIILFIQSISSASDSKALFEQGMEAFRSGNYGSSELLFRKIIDYNDDHLDRAWFCLAISIYQQKKYKAAIFEFNRFLLICNTSELCIEVRYWIAESYFHLGEYIKAIEEFKRFITRNKKHPLRANAYDRIGDIYFNDGRYDEAIIEWKNAEKFSRDSYVNSQRKLKIGEALFLNKSYGELETLLKPFISTKIAEGISARASIILGKSYQMMGKHRRALVVFNYVPDFMLKEDPYFNVQYYKAISLIAIKNNNSARMCLESFLLIGKDSEFYYDAKYELGNILVKIDKMEKGIILLEDVRMSAEKEQLRKRASFDLGGIYYTQNIEASIKYLMDSISSDDSEISKESLLLLGKAYITLQRFSDAEEVLNILTSKHPYYKDNDHVQFLLARVYLERGEVENAIDGFDRVKELNPFSKYIIESYYYLAISYMNNKQNQRAIELFEQYVKLKDAQMKYKALVQLLELYYISNDYRKSRRIMGIIIKKYSKMNEVEEIIYRYGKWLKDKGRPYKKYFNIIVKNYKESNSTGEIYLLWGDEAFIGKKYKLAERYYRFYLSTKGRKMAGSVFLYRIISLYKMGKYKKVISLISSKDLPSFDDYTSKLIVLWHGRSYYEIKDYKQAYNVIYKWKLNDYSENDLLIITRSAIEVGDLETAKKATELIHKDMDIFAEALFSLGLFYSRSEDYNLALGYFSRVVIESPLSKFIDLAKVEIAYIYIQKGKFQDAISRLKELKNNRVYVRKIALLIISYFKSNNFNEAVNLTVKNINKLLSKPFGEEVMRENLLYYYMKKDTIGAKKYTRYLNRYKGNTNETNYLLGKLYFELNKYNSSYYYFNKIVNVKSKYTEEVLSFLGLISMFIKKNVKLALKYYNKLNENKNFTKKFTVKSKINLSILLKETGNRSKSRDVLFDMLNSTPSIDKQSSIQCENLIECFNYSK